MTEAGAILHPWTVLLEVLVLLSPVIVFSAGSSLAIYVFFVLLLPRISSGHSIGRQANGNPGPNQAEPGDDALHFAYMGRFSYILVCSLFGVVLGMIIKLLGGFTVLATTPGSNTVVGAIGSVLFIIVGIAGTLFADNSKISFRRPIGAISFLLSFLVSGFYWQFLKGAIGQ